MKKYLFKVLLLISCIYSCTSSMEMPNQNIIENNSYKCLYTLTFNSEDSEMDDQELEEFKTDIQILMENIATSIARLMIKHYDVISVFDKKGKSTLQDNIKIRALLRHENTYYIHTSHEPDFYPLDNLTQEKKQKLTEFINKLHAIVTRDENETIRNILIKHSNLIFNTHKPKIEISLALHMKNGDLQTILEETNFEYIS